ncbi:hypothetical protein [Agrilutibacter solisilvae]|uniref:Uncharacterized protein n=1 Tax=Agrilutibacter solisilvae TaxID=2763317 RepID=A0A974Y1J8_9GAMM|nr:hypothetical protein [Lysobacter solisilvae]QSX79543.1 hypothetical protein I8J32_006735 [Lysobacter solisilvae]
MTRRFTTTFLALLVGAWAPVALAAGPIDCRMQFDLSGWSLFYKTASGAGTVSCDNGQSMPVRIRAKGGGITVGKSSIRDGTGEFSGVYSIDDVLGTYASSEAHAGASRSSKAMAMTKGSVSLGLAGKGEGWDLGVAFGKFVIER